MATLSHVLLTFITAAIAAAMSMVEGSDIVFNFTVTDIGRYSARLEWRWLFDDDDSINPIGCGITTRIINDKMLVVHSVELLEVVENYTVAENLTAWERYESCIMPIFENGTLGSTECSGYYVTEYDPWTWKAEIAVIVTACLTFALLIAQVINFIWPKTDRRTFSMDLYEEEDGDGNKLSEKDAYVNAVFQDDEDAGSVVQDWNAAAKAAVLADDGPVNGGKRWSTKGRDAPHNVSTIVTDLTIDDMLQELDDPNYNYSRHPNLEGGPNNMEGDTDAEVRDAALEANYHDIPGEHDRNGAWMDDQIYWEDPLPAQGPHHPVYAPNAPDVAPGRDLSHFDYGYGQTTSVADDQRHRVTHVATIEREDPGYF